MDYAVYLQAVDLDQKLKLYNNLLTYVTSADTLTVIVTGVYGEKTLNIPTPIQLGVSSLMQEELTTLISDTTSQFAAL